MEDGEGHPTIERDQGRVNSYLEAVFDRLPAGVFVIGADAEVLWCSEHLASLLGRRPSEVIGTNATAYMTPESIERLATALDFSARYEGDVMGPIRGDYVTGAGSTRTGDVWTCNALADPGIGGIVCLMLDETVDVFLAAAYSCLARGGSVDEVLTILATAVRGHPLFAHGVWIRATPSGTEAVAGEGAEHLAALACRADAPWARCLTDGTAQWEPNLEGCATDVRLALHNAGVKAVWASPLYVAGEGGVEAALVIFRSQPGPMSPNQLSYLIHISEAAHVSISRRQMEQQLRYAATHDSLTGLRNRSFLFGGEQPPTAHAVLYCDLDGFKSVNDAHGHDAGDRVLVAAAARVRSVVRDSDEVVRVGGDEFAIVCRAVRDPSDAIALADRIIEAVGVPVAIDDGEVVVGVSIGVAVGTEGLESLVEAADRAMLEAKRAGKGGWRLADLAPGRRSSRQ